MPKERHVQMMIDSLDEIDFVVDGKEDIDNNGNANSYMKVKIQADKIRYAIENLKKLNVL